MSKRIKFTGEQKLAILEELKIEASTSKIATKYGISAETIRVWGLKYDSGGIDELNHSKTWKRYSEELKSQAVEAYLNGEGSQMEICIKYGISTHGRLQDWIKRYNNGKGLKSTPGGTSKMTKGRKTAYEERIEIVNYCIDNSLNYKQTAELYGVSYQQVYTWIKKHEKGGEKALLDLRGKAKEEPQLTELDKLKIENRKLRKANENLELENKFLKKLEELEKRYH
ncbi:helix-turn-helix domain-containing protein [Tissierella sp.]|uniref:helix-turn-helix domain-containing protein n=1 Tax=Tissierella sp. TaxID=41274 RepID=UPI00285E9686|nr:helix-turn-helix domain-containing protein [Tissierella sp.]MDR7857180.1 helix-turn-helix domain-containing protein [Tissierella sp.]